MRVLVQSSAKRALFKVVGVLGILWVRRMLQRTAVAVPACSDGART
jgi:hypothetical protein